MMLVACTTLVLLTATVMQREDQDGYQATHLFFMPRQNWEMDGGRKMLYEEEYYHWMDLQALAEETLGGPPGESADVPGERAHEQEHAPSSISIPDRLSGRSHGPFLQRTPYTPNLASPGLPLVYAADESTLGPDFLYAAEAPPARPHTWRGDTRSPPPRDRTFI